MPLLRQPPCIWQYHTYLLLQGCHSTFTDLRKQDDLLPHAVLPYCVWLSLATYLNAVIWWLNRGHVTWTSTVFYSLGTGRVNIIYLHTCQIVYIADVACAWKIEMHKNRDRWPNVCIVQIITAFLMRGLVLCIWVKCVSKGCICVRKQKFSVECKNITTTEGRMNRLNKAPMRSREVHDSRHVWMQRLEAALECFKRCRRLTVIKLGRWIGEVNATLRVIVIFCTCANNISI